MEHSLSKVLTATAIPLWGKVGDSQGLVDGIISLKNVWK